MSEGATEIKKIKFSTAFLLGKDGSEENDSEGEFNNINDELDRDLPTNMNQNRKYFPIPLPNQLLSNEMFAKFVNLISQQGFGMNSNSNVSIMTNIILQQYLQKLSIRNQDLLQKLGGNFPSESPASFEQNFGKEIINKTKYNMPESSHLDSSIVSLRKSSLKPTPVPGERQPYTETELSAAVKAICFGRLGTRRAASVYGIPRSTLRNKICKLNELKKREEERLGKGPIPMSDFLMYLNKIDKSQEDLLKSSDPGIDPGLKSTAQIASRIASVFQVNCRRSNVLRSRQVNLNKTGSSINVKFPQSMTSLMKNFPQLPKSQSTKLNMSVKRKYSKMEAFNTSYQHYVNNNNDGLSKFSPHDIQSSTNETETNPKIHMAISSIKQLSDYIEKVNYIKE